MGEPAMSAQTGILLSMLITAILAVVVALWAILSRRQETRERAKRMYRHKRRAVTPVVSTHVGKPA